MASVESLSQGALRLEDRVTHNDASARAGPSVRTGKARRALLVLFAGLVGLLLTGCSAGTSGEPAGMARSTVSPGGSGCGDRETRDLVSQFLAAFNSGDVSQLDRLVSTASSVWWSTDAPGQRIDPDARDRTTLMDYFASRHRHHDRLHLESFRYNGQSGNRGNFELSLTRTADELSGPTGFGGKGAVDCSGTGLAVWSIARNP